jgi:hypothetical protein
MSCGMIVTVLQGGPRTGRPRTFELARNRHDPIDKCHADRAATCAQVSTDEPRIQAFRDWLLADAAMAEDAPRTRLATSVQPASPDANGPMNSERYLLAP